LYILLHRVKAAEILQQKQTENPEDVKISEALNELVSGLEAMLPEIKLEEEAAEAKQFMEELEDVAKISAEKLKNAKKALSKAVNDMARFEIKQERAKDREEQAAKIADLRSEADQLGSALAAMKKITEKSDTKTDASNMKAKLLSKSEAEKSNSLIASAMKDAEAGPEKSLDISERIAALKKK
jgi:hypothetical protein